MAEQAAQREAFSHADSRRRLAWARLTLTVLALTFIVVAFGWYFSRAAALADPLRIRVWGLSANALTPGKESVRFFAINDTEAGPYPLATRLWQTSYWWMEGFWVRRLLMQLPSEELARLQKLSVTVGDEAPLEATGDEVRAWPRTPTREIIVIFPLRPRESALSWVGTAQVNWPGDAAYVRTVAQYAFVPVLLVIFAGWWSTRTNAASAWRQNSLETVTEPAGSRQNSMARLWNWTGLLFLAGCLTFLEARDAYYFCQNDTIMECFPMVLTGMRSFWKGEFPDYNPYLFLGSPLASLGMYGLTYPPLHLSYALARHVLHDEYATIEVFAVLHLLVGFLATRHLGRRLGMSALPANLVALSFVLSGASLIMGRSWFNFIPLVVWLPLAFIGLVQLQNGPVTWKWILGMGLVLGMPIHVGFSQVALYIIGFFCLAAACLVLSGTLPRQRVLAIVSALCLAAGLGAPLVYQQWLASQGAAASHAPADGIALGLAATLLPYPLVQARLPVRFSNVNLHLLGQFYFFGGVLAWLFFFRLAGLFWFRPRRSEWPRHLWSICAGAALWLSLGQALGLWDLVSNLPVVGFLNRHPLRVMPFVVFFVSVAGGLVLETWLHKRVRRTGCEVLLATLALLLIGWHVLLCRTAFYVEGFAPYPRLPESFAEKFWKDGQVTGRVACWGQHSGAATDGLVMPGNLAAVYGLPQTGGLCPLLTTNSVVTRPFQRTRHSLLAHRAYGDRWHLVQAPAQAASVGSPQSWWFGQAGNLPEKLAALAEHMMPVTPPEGMDGVLLYELQGVDPLAFPCERPVVAPEEKAHERTALPVTFRGGGVDVNVSGLPKGQWLTVNFRCYPRECMQAFLDGRPIACRADCWERIVLQLPSPGETLAIRYAPSWATGFIWALLPLMACCGLMVGPRLIGCGIDE